MDIPGHRLGDVMVNENDEIMAMFFGPPFTIFSSDFYLMDLTSGTASLNAIRFFDGFSKYIKLVGSNFSGNKVTLLIHSTGISEHFILLGYDINQGNVWVKHPKVSSVIEDFEKDESGNTLVLGYSGTNPDIIELFNLDSLGNPNWSETLRLSKAGFDSFQLMAQEIGYLPGEGYYISGKFGNYNGSGLDEYFVMKLNLDGTPSIFKTIGSHALNQLYVGDDGVYLLGKTAAPFPFSDNAENAMLAKFDLNLDFQWAKVYHAEAFEYASSTLNIANDGTLVLGYSTFGAFPVVLAKLDSDGNILWQKGYPLYEPQIDALSDGSLLLTTRFHFDSTGALFPKMIVSRTDSSGNIPNCETFPTCLESDGITLGMGTFEVDTFPIDTLKTLDISSDSAHFNFSDFCDIPAPPSPEFTFPDTLCHGDSAWTAGTYNILAHKIEWRLTGGSTDSVWTDSLSFRYRFHSPGHFKLAQTVWFLGCPYSFERSITVLDDLETSIDKAGVVCDTPPVALHVNSGRPLKTFLWSTSDSSSTLEITQNGMYAVTVSDGFCTAIDSADIILVSSLLDNKPPLAVPADTVICQQELPYLLYPSSDFTDEFFLNQNPAGQLPVKLDSEGEYLISVMVEGCLFSDTFSLKTNDCEAAV
jgi:hypothetical protein